MLIWLNLPLYVPAYLCILCVYHVHVCACITVGFNVSVCFVNVCLRLSSASVRAECVLGCLSSVRKRLCVCLCTCVCVCVWNHGGGTIQPSGHLNSVYCPLVVCLHGYVIMAGIKNSLTTPTLPHARSNAHKFTCISIFQQNINRTLSHTHTLSSLCCMYACRNHKDICTVNTKPPWVSVPNIAHSCML